MISLQVLSLSDSEQRVAELVGATESLLSRRATGQRVKKVQVLLLFSSGVFALFFSPSSLPNHAILRSVLHRRFLAFHAIVEKDFVTSQKELELMLVFVIQSFLTKFAFCINNNNKK